MFYLITANNVKERTINCQYIFEQTQIKIKTNQIFKYTDKHIIILLHCACNSCTVKKLQKPKTICGYNMEIRIYGNNNNNNNNSNNNKFVIIINL